MRKLFTLTLALLASFSLWADLTAHKPGTYEKAVNQGGYGATLVTVEDLNYEVYGFSYNSSGSKPQILWAGTSTNDASASQVLCSTLSADAQEIAGWISMSTAGKSSTYSMPSSTEFAASSVGSTGLYQMKLQGHSFTIKVKGYDQFSFLGNDNNGDKSKGKYLQVTINGSDVTKDISSSTTVRRYDLNPSIESTIVITGLNTSNEHIDAFSLRIPAPSCNEAEDEGSFVAASTALTITDLVANPSTTLTFTKGDNKSEPSFAVTKGGETTTDASVVGTTFSATAAGTYIVTATQAVDETNNICEVIKQVTITVTAEIPVTACSIEGPNAGIIGQELTYTATADNANAFAWYVDDALQEGETDAEFVYTGVKGNHSIYATATNAYTATPVASNTIALNVTKLCGMLIKATHKAAKTADIDPASVVGGTVDKNTQDGGKLGSNDHYFGIKLASGNFMPEDTVIITASTSSAVVEIFSTKTFSNRNDSLNYLDHGTFDANKVYKYVLTTSTEWIYLYRTKTAGSSMNPVLGSIEVHRPCEESSNTNIAELTVNGEEVTPSGSAYTYTLSSSYEEATVTVAVTPEHPLATITDNIGGALANPFTVTTPATGESSIMPFRVVAEDGSYYNYVVTITKAASLSDDATLKALSVEGYEISPAFDAETTTYTITKAYGAETPAVGKVTATPNDANANAEVVLAADVYTITVTAENGTNTKEYTITVNTADAKKDLLEASFSNGANGYILNGNIRVPHLAGTSEPTFTAARFWNADGEPTAEIVDGKLVVTGADAKTAQYTIEYVEVTPMEASYDLITFTEVPSYIFSVYGWDADKGVKFSKDVEQAGTKRVSEGRDRIYIALPAAKSVILTGGSAGARPIKVTVNGVVDSKVTSTPAKDETITISLNQSEANFIGIESNGNNGDAGFTKMQLIQSDPTALDNTADEIKAVKFVENGQLFIRRGEKVYTITGEEVK